MTFDRIIVLLDGTPADRAALRHGIGEADRHRAGLVLMRVVPCPEPLADATHGHGGPAPARASPPDAALERERAVASRQLREVAGAIGGQRPLELVCEIGDPDRRLMARARRYRRPLVVIGASGGDGLTGHVMGPTVRRLITDGSLDVMVVHDGRPLLHPPIEPVQLPGVAGSAYMD